MPPARCRGTPFPQVGCGSTSFSLCRAAAVFVFSMDHGVCAGRNRGDEHGTGANKEDAEGAASGCPSIRRIPGDGDGMGWGEVGTQCRSPNPRLQFSELWRASHVHSWNTTHSHSQIRHLASNSCSGASISLLVCRALRPSKGGAAPGLSPVPVISTHVSTVKVRLKLM